MIQIHNGQRGFTLIETILGLAILMAALVASLIFINHIRRRTEFHHRMHRDIQILSDHMHAAAHYFQACSATRTKVTFDLLENKQWGRFQTGTQFQYINIIDHTVYKKTEAGSGYIYVQVSGAIKRVTNSIPVLSKEEIKAYQQALSQGSTTHLTLRKKPKGIIFMIQQRLAYPTYHVNDLGLGKALSEYTNPNPSEENARCKA